MKVRNFKSLGIFVFVFALAREKIFIKTYNIESRFVIQPKIYCLQAYTCTFQPGNFTRWGSEGVNGRTDITVR